MSLPFSRIPTQSQLRSFQKLVELAGEELAPDEIPGKAMQSLLGLFKPAIAAFYVADDLQKSLRVQARFPAVFWDADPAANDFRDWPIDQGSIGLALRTGESVFVEHTSSAAEKGNYIPFSPDISRELVIPVTAPDALGIREPGFAAVVLSFDRGRRFSRAERWLATSAQALLITLYSRALAQSRLAQRIDFLRGLTELQNADALFQGFLESLQELIPSKFISLWIFDSVEEALVLRSFSPAAVNNRKVELSRFDSLVLDSRLCPTGMAVRKRAAVIHRDATNLKDFANARFASHYGLRWFLSCPILDSNNDVLGVVNLWPRISHGSIDARGCAALLDYIRPAAATIRLADLLASERLLRDTNLFHELFFRFEDSRRDWDELAELVRTLMECEGCSIFLAENERLVLKGTTGLEKPVERTEYALDEGLTGRAFMMKRPLLYYWELRHKYAAIHISKHREATKERSRSIVIHGLTGDTGERIGVIRCTNKRERPGPGVARFTAADTRQIGLRCPRQKVPGAC